MKKSKQRHLLLKANFLHIFGLSMLAPVYAIYGLKIGASPWQIGLSLGLYNLVAGVINLVVGRFEDNSKRNKYYVITGFLITLVAIILFLFTKQPYQLYWVQALNAIGVGMYMPAWKLMYSRSETKGKEASQWGMFDGTNMIAMAIAATLAGWLVNYGHYQALFLSIAGFYALSTLVAFRLMAPGRA